MVVGGMGGNTEASFAMKKDDYQCILGDYKFLFGADLHNFDAVFFVKPPDSFIQLLQGAGRVSRLGEEENTRKQGLVVLLHNASDFSSNRREMDPKMKEFCTSKQCRRTVLREAVGCEQIVGEAGGLWCCDICDDGI